MNDTNVSILAWNKKTAIPTLHCLNIAGESFEDSKTSTSKVYVSNTLPHMNVNNILLFSIEQKHLFQHHIIKPKLA